MLKAGVSRAPFKIVLFFEGESSGARARLDIYLRESTAFFPLCFRSANALTIVVASFLSLTEQSSVPTETMVGARSLFYVVNKILRWP